MSIVAYTFGRFSLFPSRYILSGNGIEHQLTPRLLAVLQYLLQHPNRVVTKQELIAEVWRGRVVELENAGRTISTLRSMLGDSRNNPTYIQTVSRVGYRFIHPVTTSHPTTSCQQADQIEVPRFDDYDTFEK